MVALSENIDTQLAGTRDLDGCSLAIPTRRYRF